jgi:hypothetical protein
LRLTIRATPKISRRFGLSGSPLGCFGDRESSSRYGL